MRAFIVWTLGWTIAVGAGCQRQSPSTTQPAQTVSDVGETETPSETAAPTNLGPKLKAHVEPTVKRPAADAKVHQVTARDFYDEKKKDPKATATKYANSWVEVSGKYLALNIVPQDKSEGYVVQVGITPTDSSFDIISCVMAAGEQPWKEAAHAEEITIRGVVANFYDNIYLAECKVVKPGEPTLNVTVDELAKVFEEDQKAFSDKYSNGECVISGKFAGFMLPEGETEEPAEKFIALDGASGRRLFAFLGNNKQQFSGIQPGDSLTVIGDVYAFVIEKDMKLEGFLLQDCQNLTPFVTPN